MLDLPSIDAQRICLIKPSALGDVVQTLPLLSALAQRFPGSRISWVINRELAELIEGHPLLDDVLVFDRRGTWRESASLLTRLWRAKFDLVLDLQGLLRSGVMALATGARLRVGLQTAREGAHLACHVTVPETGRDVPAHARYWKVAEALGVCAPRGFAEIPTSAADCEVARDTLTTLHREKQFVLAIHAGAKWETKRWPADKFAEVARRAANNAAIVVVGSPTERPLAEAIVSTVRTAGGIGLDLTGRTSLKQLAALLQQADLMLSNDSGPMHLAAEQGTPVVGIFTCTDALRSGPPGEHHLLISTSVPCAGGYHKTCPFRDSRRHACFDAVDVERVWRAVQTQFARLPLRRAG